MVKEFIRTPQHSFQTPGSEEPPFLAHSNGMGASDDEKPRNGMERRHSDVEQTKSIDWEAAQSKQNVSGKRTIPDKVDPDNRLLERVASELYHCQENLLPFDLSRNLSPLATEGAAGERVEGEDEEEEDEVLVENGVRERGREVAFHPASAPTSVVPQLQSQDSYRDLLTILENPSDQDDPLSPTMAAKFRPKLGTVAVHSSNEISPTRGKGPGYRMIQRGLKNPHLSRDATFNDFSRMRESYGYEGPPSPQTKERFVTPARETEEREGGRVRRATKVDVKKLKRKTAIRRQRRKVGSLSELPPETSYSYQVCTSHTPHTSHTSHIKHLTHLTRTCTDAGFSFRGSGIISPPPHGHLLNFCYTCMW